MRKLYTIPLAISISLIVVAVVVIAVFGLRLGIDFQGGTLIEVGFENVKPPVSELQDAVQTTPNIELSTITVVPTENSYIIRTGAITQEAHQAILVRLNDTFGPVKELRFENIGPSIGKELKDKSVLALILVLAGIAIYVAIAFRKISRFANVWLVGGATIFALFHDIILTIGVFVVKGVLTGYELDAVMVAALLTIAGYSVNDTVVIFDRLRENIIMQGGDLRELLHLSIKQTLVRSLSTGGAALLSLIAIALFGGPTLHNFALALILGITFGTYSSIFVAAPLVMLFHRQVHRTGKR